MSVFEPPELLKLYKVYQICSIYAYAKMMMFRISIQGGIKLHYPQVKFLRKRSCKVYTSENYRVLFCCRLCWQCMNRRISETVRQPSFSGLKTAVRPHTDQANEDKKFQRPGTKSEERDSKGKKANSERRVGECHRGK